MGGTGSIFCPPRLLFVVGALFVAALVFISDEYASLCVVQDQQQSICEHHNNNNKSFFCEKKGGSRRTVDDDNNNKEWVSRYNGTCLQSESTVVPDWQRRAPLVTVIGMQKGGTKALDSYLCQHPLRSKSIRGPGEIHFFDTIDTAPNEFGKRSGYVRLNRSSTAGGGIDRELNVARYAARFERNRQDILADPAQFAIDDSPRYMLFSDRVPDALLCVAPWVKLIALLRNPIDRIVSAYNMFASRPPPPAPVVVVQDNEQDGHNQQQQHGGGGELEWDDFLGSDLALLKKHGVIQDWNKVDFDSYAGSEQETAAWEDYLQNFEKRWQEMPLGRGLYAIMLGHYFAAMDKIGKPRSDMLILRSEDMIQNTQAVYDRVTDFLHLPRHTLQSSEAVHVSIPGKKIPDHWLEFLIDFYEPYNRRLYKMLGWDPVWDDNNNNNNNNKSQG